MPSTQSTSTTTFSSNPSTTWTPSLTYVFNFDGSLSYTACSCTVSPGPTCPSCPCLPPSPTHYAIDSAFENPSANMDGLLSRGGTEDDLRRTLDELVPDVRSEGVSLANAREAMFKQDLVSHTAKHWREIDPFHSRTWALPTPTPQPALSKWASAVYTTVAGKKEEEAHKHTVTKEQWEKSAYDKLAERRVEVVWEDVDDFRTRARTRFVSEDGEKGEGGAWAVKI
ncbi:hypothetical protein IAT38_000121 [Cryptococcus sp. DSM 104549]